LQLLREKDLVWARSQWQQQQAQNGPTTTKNGPSAGPGALGLLMANKQRLRGMGDVAVCCSVLQCGVQWCSVLQCVAVWCSAVQCGAVRRGVGSVLQCVAECCNVLYCVAVCCGVLWVVAVRHAGTADAECTTSS